MDIEGQFSRNELYWGAEFQKKLANLKIAVFGLGGVGGFALEALARAGVENFILVDFDKISTSNINRQIVALHSTVGQSKVSVWENRLKDIDPKINLEIFEDFYREELNNEIFSLEPNYVVDAIDTLRSKISLLKYCHKKIPIITSFGAGNRMDASKLKLVELSEIKTSCSFAKNVISKLKKEGIERSLPVIISDEVAHNLEKVENIEKIQTKSGETLEFKKFTPASISTVPAVCGYLMANWILCDFYAKVCKVMEQR